MHKRSQRELVRDYVLYVALAVSTLFIFGYPIQWFRTLRRRWEFWLAPACLLALHLTVYVGVLLQVRQFRTLWFFLIGIPESRLIAWLIHRLGIRTGKWTARGMW